MVTAKVLHEQVVSALSAIKFARTVKKFDARNCPGIHGHDLVCGALALNECKGDVCLGSSAMWCWSKPTGMSTCCCDANMAWVGLPYAKACFNPIQVGRSAAVPLRTDTASKGPVRLW